MSFYYGRKPIPTGTKAGMKWELGDLALYRGRLVELTRLSSGYSSYATVELTDDGGTVHVYDRCAGSELTPLAGEGECVLDAIKRAAAQPQGEFAAMRRTAEIWLADPRAGDTFYVGDEIVELVDIGQGGTIWGAITALPAIGAGRTARGVCFTGGNELRRWMSSDEHPPYKARAVKSLRTDEASKKLPPYRGV